MVNVSPAFREVASELAERHQYIYWQDDTHWNECGVSIAAAEFRARIGLQQLSGLVRETDPPATKVEWKVALPPDCQSQQKYAATSWSSR